MADPYAAFSSPVAAPTSQGDPYAAFSSPVAAAPAGPTADEMKPFTGLTPNERARAAPRHAAEPPTTWADVGNGVRNTVEQFGTGANEKLATTIARPIDAASNLLNKPAEWLTGNPAPAPHLLENAVRDNFVDNHFQPRNDHERIARSAGGMAMENLPLSAGGVAAAAKYGPQIGEAVAPAIGGVWNTIKGGVSDYAGAMARKPGAALVGDTVGAGESGAGGEVGRQSAQDNGGGTRSQQTGEVTGQFAVPALAAAYTKFGPVGGIKLLGSTIADAVLRHLPEEMLPAYLRPAGGSAAQRQAEQLSFSNNEGKYAPNAAVNNVPTKDLPVQPPPAPGYVAQRMDAGAQARADDATNTVAKGFGKITSRPEVQENLTEANRLKAEIPGFEPGVAKATNDPALLNRQANLDSTAINEDLRAAQDRTDKSHGAIRTYLDETVPAAAGAPPQDTAARANASRVQGVNDRLETQRGAVSQQIDQRTAATQQRLEGERGATQSQIDARQAATQQQLDQEQTQARGRIRDISNSLPETDPTVVGNELRATRQSLRGQADEHMATLRRGVDPSGTGVVTLPRTAPDAEPVTMSVNAALNRRAQINQDLADHFNSTSRDQAAQRDIRRLQTEKATLDGAIEDASSAGAEGLAEYNRYYREDYAPKFLQGASNDVGRFASRGYEGNKVSSEDVPGKFFNPNSVSEARQFNRLYGNNPEVRQRMTDFALDDLRRTAVDPNTGMIREGAVNKWLAKNERVLNEMPWVREAVTGRNPDAHYQQIAQTTERQRLAGNPKTLAQVDPEVAPLQAKLGQTAEQQRLASNPKTIGQVEPEVSELQKRFGDLEQRQRRVADTTAAGLVGQNGEKTIAAALADHTKMRALKASARGDPQVEAALRRAVWEHVLAKGGGEGPLDSAALQQMLQPEAAGGNRRALAEIFDAQHLNRIDNATKATKIENRLDRPTGTYEKPQTIFSKFEDAVGTSVPSLGATASALARGRSSPVYEVPRVLFNAWRGISTKQVNEIWKEALSNPKVMEQLQMVGKGGVANPRQIGRMVNYTATLGIHDTKEASGTDK